MAFPSWVWPAAPAGALVALGALAASLGFPHRPGPEASGAPRDVAPASRLEVGASEPIQPILRPRPGDPRRVALGRRLFAEPKLSIDGSVSCETCHPLARGGVDGRKLAVGVAGAAGEVNTPTVFNADLNLKQFWDGRAESLEAQIDGPLTSPVEMGSSWEQALAALRRDPIYASKFAAAYPEGLTRESVKDAIASFERTLVTCDSPFDRFLAGDKGALTLEQARGYGLFKSYGCVSCHQGRNVGGNLFAKMGVASDYFAERGGPLTAADQGRFNVTGREEDRFKFRVPSLRLAARTAPYFHDGYAETLERAVTLMARFQLGEELPPADASAIAAFLASLAGDTGFEAPHASR